MPSADKMVMIPIPLFAAQTLLLSGRMCCFEGRAVAGSPYKQSVEWLEKSVAAATGEEPETWWKE